MKVMSLQHLYLFLIKTLLIFFILLSSNLFGQTNHRISGDFTQKFKGEDGKLNLIKGKFFYDVKFGKSVYEISFPSQQVWVFEDTVQLVFIADTLHQTRPISYSNELSIFHLSLTQNLSNYGLKNSIFEIEKTEVEKDQVITYWKPYPKFRKKFGKVVLSKKDKQLFGVLFYDPKDQLLRKQFYRNYTIVKGVSFPTEVIDIFFKDLEERYQKTEYKNIIINETGKDHLYRYRYVL